MANDSMGFSVSGIKAVADDITKTKSGEIDPRIESIYGLVDSMQSEGGWKGSSYDKFKSHMETFKTEVTAMLTSMEAKAAGFTKIASEGESTTTDVDAAIDAAFNS